MWLPIVCQWLVFVTPILAQLPLQIKPKVRGIPGKYSGNSEILARGEIELMYRLNNSFTPTHYDVQVRVILDEDEAGAGDVFTAPGKVKIVGRNEERSSRIVLHAKEILLNESSVAVVATANPALHIDISNTSMDSLRDFLIIELGTEIDAGEELEIAMEYTAVMRQKGEGLFYRNYENENGELRTVAATQFQAVDARRMFPCFDEPALKATFQLTVIRTENYTSLSNTELVSSVPDPEFSGWIMDTYAKTVKMSTYLLALTVTDYEYIEAFFGNRSTRIYGPKVLINAGSGNYAANVTSKCLDFYEKHFNETYKLSKMDSVAIPEFDGAMENFGLNIYGPTYLLFLPTEQSEMDRTLITLIIAHELAHQMFGNLVTIKWWNHLFLNEGISTYVQYLGMEAASPELGGVEYKLLDSIQYSMVYDARPNSHPLSNNVSTPEEIDEMFTTISYEKGASVMTMIEGFITKETLLKGLQFYLKSHSFNATDQDDLFNALQIAADEDNRLPANLTVQTIMRPWTEQVGFPLVKVDVENATHVRFSQQRFKNHKTEYPDGFWYIPISILTAAESPLKNNLPKLWLENRNVSQVFPHDTTKWILINNNVTGFYRTMYAEPLALLIKMQLESDPDLISPLSRSQLIDDYFVLSKQKYVNIQAALNFTTYLHQETHFTVWGSFLEHFKSIYEKFVSHPGYPVLQAYLRPKVDRALVRVGLEESSGLRGSVAVLRGDLLDWSCSMRSPLCREYALKLLAQWQANSTKIPFSSVDAKATLLCAIVAEGGKPAFDLVFGKYKQAVDADLREEWISALACATDTSVLETLLNKTLDSESGLVSEDAVVVLGKVAKNPVGRSLILNFLSTHIIYIVDIIGNGHARPVGVVLGTLSTYYTTQSQLDQIQDFIDANEQHLKTIVITLRAVVTIIKDNIAWMKTTGFDIWTWLWFQ